MRFLLIAVTVALGLHLYLYRRLVHDTATGRGRRLGGWLLAGLLVVAVASVQVSRVLDPAGWPARALVLVGGLWLVLTLYLALGLTVLELPRRLLGRRRHDPLRRRALARLFAALAGIAAAGTVGFGVTQARPPRVVRREVPLDRLDRALDGVTIGVIADVHLGPINNRAFLADVVATLNGARPDLVAIVGDLVDGSVAHLGSAASALADLRAPAFFVTGNHEYFSGAQQWCEFLPTLGVRVLRNERVAVGRLGAHPAAPTFDLAGIDDRVAYRSHEPGHGANLDQALAGRDPARPVVLLAHQPVMVRQAADRDVDLQISGHTHGGQILPLGYVVLLDQPVLAGLTRVDRTWLYVTRGTGFWGAPVRVGAPPEITLLTLRSPART